MAIDTNASVDKFERERANKEPTGAASRAEGANLADVLGRCCYGGLKPKTACGSCASWKRVWAEKWPLLPPDICLPEERPNGEVRGASRLAGEASSAEGAASTVVLERD